MAALDLRLEAACAGNGRTTHEDGEVLILQGLLVSALSRTLRPDRRIGDAARRRLDRVLQLSAALPPTERAELQEVLMERLLDCRMLGRRLPAGVSQALQQARETLAEPYRTLVGLFCDEDPLAKSGDWVPQLALRANARLVGALPFALRDKFLEWARPGVTEHSPLDEGAAGTLWLLLAPDAELQRYSTAKGAACQAAAEYFCTRPSLLGRLDEGIVERLFTVATRNWVADPERCRVLAQISAMHLKLDAAGIEAQIQRNLKTLEDGTPGSRSCHEIAFEQLSGLVVYLASHPMPDGFRKARLNALFLKVNAWWLRERQHDLAPLISRLLPVASVLGLAGGIDTAVQQMWRCSITAWWRSQRGEPNAQATLRFSLVRDLEIRTGERLQGPEADVPAAFDLNVLDVVIEAWWDEHRAAHCVRAPGPNDLYRRFLFVCSDALRDPMYADLSRPVLAGLSDAVATFQTRRPRHERVWPEDPLHAMSRALRRVSAARSGSSPVPPPTAVVSAPQHGIDRAERDADMSGASGGAGGHRRSKKILGWRLHRCFGGAVFDQEAFIRRYGEAPGIEARLEEARLSWLAKGHQRTARTGGCRPGRSTKALLKAGQADVALQALRDNG